MPRTFILLILASVALLSIGDSHAGAPNVPREARDMAWATLKGQLILSVKSGPAPLEMDGIDIDTTKIALAPGYACYVLREKDGLAFARSSDIDPAPFAALPKYYFPIEIDGKTYGAVGVMHNRHTNSEKIDPDKGEFLAAGPKANHDLEVDLVVKVRESLPAGYEIIGVFRFLGIAPNPWILVGAESVPEFVAKKNGDLEPYEARLPELKDRLLKVLE